MPEIRDLLHAAAARPAGSLDTDGILTSARRRTRRRQAGAVAALVSVALLLVGIISVVPQREQAVVLNDPAVSEREPAVPVGEGDMLGLDEVLPVVEGTWQELVPPGGDWDPTPYRVSLWDGTEVVVVDTVSAQAYDAGRDTWRSLPNLPSDELEHELQGVVVDGTVVVADTVGPDRLRSVTLTVAPEAEDVGRSDAWALVADRWEPVTAVPDAVELIGVADGQIISARYAGSQAAPRVQLWRSDMTGSDPTALPPPPMAMQATQVIDTPDGFVVLGSQVVDGSGSEVDPFVLEGVGLHWVQGAWEVLDLPDTDFLGAAAVWVPVPPGRAQNPDPAGGLVIVGGQHDEPDIPGVAYDLATGNWTTIDVPPIERESATRFPWWTAAWDGNDTVWVYGGYPSSIHLALDLPTGQLRVAEPTGGRVRADLHWDGEGLLLLGGFGPSGPVSVVERWTPADR